MNYDPITSHNDTMLNNFYNQPFPNIDIDDTLYLREQRIEDTQDFFDYYTDPDVSRYILATIPTNLAEARSEIHYCRNLFHQYKNGIFWTLAKKETDRMIGSIGLYMNNYHYRGELSYELAKQYWNQGIMTKVLRRVIDYCFQEMGLLRLEGVTTKENVASTHLLEKLGFDLEGTLKNYRYFNGKAHDVEMYGLTP